jgi:5S rRNA maturation endonuclease (ribonuclease M5)
MGHISNLSRDSVVVLVEGAWSVMRIHQVIKPLHPNIVPIATLGTWLTDELRTFLYDREILAILDADEGGNTVTSQLQRWSDQGIKVESYNVTLSNEVAYVDDVTDAQLKRLFQGISSSTHTKLWNKTQDTKLTNRFGMIRQAEALRFQHTS